jgi:head-tail adaptor
MARGAYRHVVTFQNPAPAVADGDGSYTQSWIDLEPAAWPVSIEQATARDLERVAAGTVLSAASYLVRGDLHPGVTTQSRLLFKGRPMSITGVHNVQERDITMELIAVEQVV